MCQKNSDGIDGGLGGGSSVRRPGSEDPHRKFFKILVMCLNLTGLNYFESNWLNQVDQALFLVKTN